MTIEEKIKTLIEMYHYIRGDVHFCGYNEEDVTNAFETAVDTMKKYHRIQEVMDNRPDDDVKSNSKALSEIEVIMYGNSN